MKMLSRLLVLVGAAATLGSVTLPWAKVEGALPVVKRLNVDVLGAKVSQPGQTVSGTDTNAWIVVVAVGGLVALLALFGLARRLLVVLGLLTTLGGAGVLYYVVNAVDIKTSGSVLQPAAKTLLDSNAGAGPLVLIAGGLCILVGALIP